MELREPESEDEGPNVLMEVSEGQGEVEWAEEDLLAHRIEDRAIKQATNSWITGGL